VLDLAISEPPLAGAGSQLGILSERRYVNLTPAAHHLIGYAEQTFGSARSAKRDSRLTSFWLDLLLDALRQQSELTADRPTRSLARAKAFIDRYFDQPIDMANVVGVAGLGASRLYELFQEHLGTTPRGYLAEVRLRHALALLANTRLSIAEIAVRTGHADQSSLTRHLRRACRITPAAYRRGLVSHGDAAGGSAQSAGDQVKRR
jgi:AraC-like DNA-binding protein